MIAMPRPTISAVVITFNEEPRLRGCLESLQWVDEIVVVDAESRDGTVTVARAFTERVFVRPWSGFPVQRNFGISQARGEWILILDADERVPPEAQREIIEWLASPDAARYAAAQVPRRNFFFGKWLRYGGAYPDVQWRLFRRDKIRYDERTLDTPIVDGPCKVLREPLNHFTGETVSDRLRKIQRETEYKAREGVDPKRRVGWPDLVFRPLATFIKIWLGKQGARDGIEGLLYAILSSFYTFVRYVKRWELTRV